MCTRGKTCFTWPVSTHRWLRCRPSLDKFWGTPGPEFSPVPLLRTKLWRERAGWQWLDETTFPREFVYIYTGGALFSLFFSNPNERTNKHEKKKKKKKKKTSRLYAAIWFQFSRQHFGRATSAHTMWREDRRVVSAVSAWISFPYLQDPDSKTNTHSTDRTRQRFPEGASWILSRQKRRGESRRRRRRKNKISFICIIFFIL